MLSSNKLSIACLYLSVSDNTVLLKALLIYKHHRLTLKTTVRNEASLWDEMLQESSNHTHTSG